MREHFHAHTGDLAKLHWAVQIPKQRLGAVAQQRVKSVTTFVQQRLHIVVRTDRVHENVSFLRQWMKIAETARSLALARFQIEVTGHQRPEQLTQHGVEAVKDALRGLLEIGGVGIGFQWSAARTVDLHVPRAQRRQLERFAVRSHRVAQ